MVIAASRVDAPESSASMYTLVVHDDNQVVWRVRVLDSPQSDCIYLDDAVHPANNGVYP
jgi:hypothetical protein